MHNGQRLQNNIENCKDNSLLITRCYYDLIIIFLIANLPDFYNFTLFESLIAIAILQRKF